MKIKNIFSAIIYGAAITIGSALATKGIDMLRDPCKKAKIKRTFKNIKLNFIKKTRA